MPTLLYNDFFVSKPVVGSVEAIISVLNSFVLGSSTLGSVPGSSVSLRFGSKIQV